MHGERLASGPGTYSIGLPYPVLSCPVLPVSCYCYHLSLYPPPSILFLSLAITRILTLSPPLSPLPYPLHLHPYLRIQVLGAERLILIGDQNQLPPVVASPQALEHGLGVSLFARLAISGITPILLNEQCVY